MLDRPTAAVERLLGTTRRSICVSASVACQSLGWRNRNGGGYATSETVSPPDLDDRNRRLPNEEARVDRKRECFERAVVTATDMTTDWEVYESKENSGHIQFRPLRARRLNGITSSEIESETDSPHPARYLDRIWPRMHAESKRLAFWLTGDGGRAYGTATLAALFYAVQPELYGSRNFLKAFQTNAEDYVKCSSPAGTGEAVRRADHPTVGCR